MSYEKAKDFNKTTNNELLDKNFERNIDYSVWIASTFLTLYTNNSQTICKYKWINTRIHSL